MSPLAKRPILLLALVVLTGGVFGAKWKREHPTASTHDLQVRRQFLDSPRVTLMSLELGSPNRNKTYILTEKDKHEIAPHLWFYRNSAKAITTYLFEGFVMHWFGPIPKGQIKSINSNGALFMRARWQEDLCALPLNGYYDEWKPDWVPHPVTSQFLRQWLAEHP